MRLLVFHRTPAPVGGGANQFVMDLLPRLRAAGLEIALVHTREAKSTFRGTGYLFDELKDLRPLAGKERARLDAIVEDFQPDIVQMHDVPNVHVDFCLHGKVPVFRCVHNHQSYCSGSNMTWQFPLQGCSERHGRRCLVRHWVCRCGSLNPVSNILRYATIRQNLEALRKATGVQAMSHAVGENLLRNGVDPARFHLLPAPVPAPRIDPASARAKNGRRMVLHVGGLLTKKGVWVALRTLRVLPEDCDLAFAGGGAEGAALESHVRHRGLGHRVRIYSDPTPDDWQQLYAQASLVIMPSLWNEPLGLAGLRAFAFGKPVVAFRAGGIPDWIQHGISGILIPPSQRRTFPSVVASLLREPERLALMGANAKVRWENSHRMESHIEKLLEAYRAATDKA